MASFAARAPPLDIRKPQRTKTKNIRRILQIRITTNKHEWSERGERHRRQSREGKQRGSGEATEFQFTGTRNGAITFNYWSLISQYSPRRTCPIRDAMLCP